MRRISKPQGVIVQDLHQDGQEPAQIKWIQQEQDQTAPSGGGHSF